MKRGILLGAICLLPFFLRAQGKAVSIKLVSFEHLQQRLQQGTDTTFVVNFWATWCGPCLEEIPYFDRLQEKYSSKKVKVLLVSLDFRSQLKTGVIPFVKKSELISEVILLDEADHGAIIEKIDPSWSGALPATLLVNTATGAGKFHEGSFNFDELEAFYLLTQ
ncbi:MAG TPA: TlpA disulfide reductase family protein [Anseongella sp.]